MKKGKTFDYYLQEALKELEKPCEEFDAAKCERLLQNCVNALLQGEYSLREDINGNAVKEEFQSTGKVAKYPKSQLIVFAEKFQSPGGYSHDKTIVFLSSTSHNRSCSFVRNGLDGSCNRVFTACSSVFSPCRPATSRGRNADSPYGRFHSNPPKGELNEKQGKAKGNQRLFTVAVEIDSFSGETVRVKANSPEKALAEALSKLTPGVKTIVEE